MKDEDSRPPRLLQFVCRLEGPQRGGRRYIFEDAMDNSMVKLSPVEVKRLKLVNPVREVA